MFSTFARPCSTGSFGTWGGKMQKESHRRSLRASSTCYKAPERNELLMLSPGRTCSSNKLIDEVDEFCCGTVHRLVRKCLYPSSSPLSACVPCLLTTDTDLHFVSDADIQRTHLVSYVWVCVCVGSRQYAVGKRDCQQRDCLWVICGLKCRAYVEYIGHGCAAKLN